MMDKAIIYRFVIELWLIVFPGWIYSLVFDHAMIVEYEKDLRVSFVYIQRSAPLLKLREQALSHE